MTRPKVLVVYKKSAYQVYAVERKEPRVRALIKQNARSVRILTESHQAHEDSLLRVVQALHLADCDVRTVYRAHMRRISSVDLVVTVGGDGTLLDASHKIDGVPMLGVNSNPARSVGFLAGANAQTFERVLREVLRGRLKPTKLLRLDVELNGRSVEVPVLNDVLFCHVNPAATSRYILHRGGEVEEQKSSGIWVATPAGSTAAILSAGGVAEPLTSRRFQYRVREPYAPPGQTVRMVHGFVAGRGSIDIENYMREGAMFLDGSHIRFKLGMGDVVTIRAHRNPLHVFRPT